MGNENNQICAGFDPNKIYMLGERDSGLKPRGSLQNYHELLACCKENYQLFEDPQFCPENVQLGQGIKTEKVQWKRPHEIVENPKFKVDGTTRFDIKQGSLGDCWFLAAVSNITLNRRLSNFIVPSDQDFDKNYAGIFHFRFWQYGRWLDIVVDDRLPTINNQLIFLKSNDENEFWPSLLEKAYAKLQGSYANLDGGFTSEALEDFTGGLSVMYYTDRTDNLRNIMKLSYKKCSYMGCAILGNTREEKKSNGLVANHAYSITKVEDVETIDGERLTLVRIRNPWGEHEWLGPWSDSSKNWRMVPENVRNRLLKKEEDGEFWMRFNDFVKSYTFVEICYSNPNSYEINETEIKNWNCLMFDGSWIANATAGGSPKYKTFSENPQYVVEVKGADPKKEYSVIIALMQKNRRLLGDNNNYIAFLVYDNSEVMDFSHPPLCYKKFESHKQIVLEVSLYPGTYRIIPCTDVPNITGDFLLRVFSEQDIIHNHLSVGYSNVKLHENTTDRKPDQTFYQYFLSLAGEDKVIDWKELKSILDGYQISSGSSGFSKEVCRSLLAIFDADFSGKLSYQEFLELWRMITAWKAVFNKYSSETGTIRAFQFSAALNAAGYTINSRVLNILMLRYGNEKNEIELDDFILCVVKLKTIIDAFKNKKSNKYKQASISIDEWVQSAIYS